MRLKSFKLFGCGYLAPSDNFLLDQCGYNQRGDFKSG